MLIYIPLIWYLFAEILSHNVLTSDMSLNNKDEMNCNNYISMISEEEDDVCSNDHDFDRAMEFLMSEICE